MDASCRKRFEHIAQSLENITVKKPETYHEAIQLFWLYSLIALPRNYGRMDVYLGDFLVQDMDCSRVTYEQAFDMTCGLWRLIVDRTDNFNNRIIIGGKGRRNEKNADRFALLAIKKVIYDRKTMTPSQLMECLDKNFEGSENERLLLCALPKYGNDIKEADDMAVRVNHMTFDLACKQAEATKLDSFNIVLVNNGDSITLGKATGASADGRKAGELEAALKNPEKYRSLIVRVGGYSERFVDLPQDVQMEVMRRTLHE